LKEAIDEVVSLGLGVEVWTNRGENDPEPAAALLKEIRGTCKRAPFVTLHTRPQHWVWNLEGLRREIGYCRDVGARTLVLHQGSLGLHEPSDRADFFEIGRLAKEALQAGVMFAIENRWDNLWMIDRVLDEIGDDPKRTNLGVCIDVGHANLSKDAGRQPVRAYLERYRTQLIHLHLHDNHGETDDHLLPGKGTIDWPDLFRTLDEIAYSGPMVLELHFQNDPLEEIKEARTFVERLIGEVGT
jgi:sugar phosphate isomerase/epimerase